MTPFLKPSISRTETAILALAVLLLFLMTAAQFHAGYIGDKIWKLTATHKWLDGAKLYVDISEMNPPLQMWLYALPVSLANHTHLMQDYHFLVLMGLITIACVIYVSCALIKLHPAFAHDRRQQLEFCLLLASVFITFQNPCYFLDREHIFLVLIVPYLLRFTPSLAKAPVPSSTRIITGLLAGLGFCVKPHCLIVFAGIQLLYIWRERSLAILRSPENLLIYLFYAVYIALIWLYTPEYITTMVPMAFYTYGVINKRLTGMVFFTAALLPLGLTFADFRLRYTSPYRKDILYLAATLPFFIGYALANNGWGYTWNVFASAITIVTGFVFWEYRYLKEEHEKEGLPFRQFVFGMRACMIAFTYNAAAAAVYIFFALTSCENPFECEAGATFLKNLDMADNGMKISSFGTISIDFQTWSYFSRTTGARWDTRFYHIWMLPKFFSADKAFANRHQWILDYVENAYAEDLKNHKPQIMFVEQTDDFYTVRKGMDLLTFLSISPAFSQEWSHYRYIGTLDEPYELKHYHHFHHGYYVYKRIEN